MPSPDGAADPGWGGGLRKDWPPLTAAIIACPSCKYRHGLRFMCDARMALIEREEARTSEDYDALIAYLATVWQHIIPSGEATLSLVRLGLLAEVPTHKMGAPKWVHHRETKETEQC